MKYLLKDIDLFEDSDRQKFARIGIENTDQLLMKAAHPHQRVEIEKDLGITGEKLLLWSSIADLVRVKGVGPKLAQLLVRTPQIKSVQDLANSEPEALRRLLEEVNANYRILHRSPTEREIIECIEEAQELKPRLVTEIITPLNFRAEVKELKQQYEDLSKRQNRGWRTFDFQVFTLFILLMVLLFLLFEFDIWPVRSRALFSLMYQAEWYWLLFNVSWVISAVVAAIVLIRVGQYLLKLKLLFLSNYIRFRLFDRPLYQRCYLYMEESAKTTSFAKASEIVIQIFTVFVIVVLILLLIVREVDLFLVALFAGALMVFVVAYPDLQRVWRVYKESAVFGPATLQRYLVYRLLGVFLLLLLLWIALQILLPTVVSGHRYVVGEWLIPSFETRVDEIKHEIVSLSLNDNYDTRFSRLFLAKYESSRTEPLFKLAMLQFDDLLSLPEGEVISQLSTVMVWLLILGIFLYFVIPLIFLQKIWPALLFIVIAGLSEGLGQLLTSQVPGAYSLPPGSLVAIVFSATLFLSNTILFDWLYQETTGSHKQCLVCGQELEATAKFCTNCGNPQLTLDTVEQH